jgi:MoaA/NifB/PqqE/SkfB family radical SAM enzyme
MPCTNRCRHCWTQGSVTHQRVPARQVRFVLEKLADLRSTTPQLGFFLYDEPTNHPQFIEIMERAVQLELIDDQFFLPTNGSILAQAPDDTWERLRNTGCDYLQFTVYGLEQTHDRFAGRKGAFQNIVTAARRANEFGIGWYAGVILHQGSVSELPDAIAYVRGLDPTGESRVGWFPFLWQGRGRDAERVRIDEYARLPEEMRRRRTSLVDERRGAEMILDDPKLSDRQASETLCSALVFHVERDLSVYCGGACDSGGIAAAAPELRGHFYLGKLTEDGFEPLLDAYRRRPPLGVRLLEGVTWGRLASRYGDRTNDEIYHLNDLPENKWATAYLLDSLR